MYYFRHRNTAHQGHTLGYLYAHHEHDAIALFWLILELCSALSEEDDLGHQTGRFTISLRVLSSKMNMKPSRTARLTEKIRNLSGWDIEFLPDGNVSFLIDKFAELQERRGISSKVLDAKKIEETRIVKSIESRVNKNPPIVPQGGPDPALLVQEFNQHTAGALVQVRKQTDEVRRLAMKALKLDPSLENWRKVFTWFRTQDWANGKNKDKYRADFRVATRQRHYEAALQSVSSQPESWVSGYKSAFGTDDET